MQFVEPPDTPSHPRFKQLIDGVDVNVGWNIESEHPWTDPLVAATQAPQSAQIWLRTLGAIGILESDAIR